MLVYYLMWQAIADCSLVDIFVGITVNKSIVT